MNEIMNPHEDNTPTARLAWAKSMITNKAMWIRAGGLLRECADPRLFSRPADQAEALVRVRANFGAFRLLYGLIYLSFLTLSIITSPWLLCGLAIIGGAWG